MKYKVGDKVRIVDTRPDGGFVRTMNKYLGTIMTIKEVHKEFYKMEEDQTEVPNGWNWKESYIASYAVFAKDSLETGDVVKCRNGRVYIVNKDLDMMICVNGFERLRGYNTNLTHINAEGFDIVAVRRPISDYHCQFSAFESSLGVLVYERVEPEEMTLEEVCKLLGKQIKIIP